MSRYEKEMGKKLELELGPGGDDTLMSQSYVPLGRCIRYFSIQVLLTAQCSLSKVMAVAKFVIVAKVGSLLLPFVP